mgnify:CR=1 FL=1
MRLLYINPNATVAMTETIVATAQATLLGAEVIGWTNHDGPPAIQGPEDGAAAVPGLLALLPKAAQISADAIVIACFDDTGLEAMRAAAHCPVIGIGQAAFHMAALMGGRFSVVTTLAVSVPVIAQNIETYGFAGICASVRPSGLPVLTVEGGGEAVLQCLSAEIAAAHGEGAASVVLGCAGMAHLKADLAAVAPLPLIDGVAASALLAEAMTRLG